MYVTLLICQSKIKSVELILSCSVDVFSEDETKIIGARKKQSHL